MKPRPLQNGSRIGIVCLSSSLKDFSETRIQNFKARLEQEFFQFKLILAPNLFKESENGLSAGSVEERVASMHAFFKDSSIDGIMAFWGGLVGHQILDSLDFELIKKNPKVFIGYSDTTSALLAIHKMTGLVTFNGPAGITFAKPEVPQFTIDAFKNQLFALSNPYQMQPVPVSTVYSENAFWMEGDVMKWIPNDRPTVLIYPKEAGSRSSVEGKSLAANLVTLLKLAGTKYWPDFKDAILFLEEEDSSPIEIDSCLSQLGMLGVWNDIRALMFGRFMSKAGFNGKGMELLRLIVRENLDRYGCDLPVIAGLDWGHTEPAVVVPIGISCRVTINPVVEIVFLESSVRMD